MGQSKLWQLNGEFAGIFLHLRGYVMEGVMESAWAMLLKQQVES